MVEDNAPEIAFGIFMIKGELLCVCVRERSNLWVFLQLFYFPLQQHSMYDHYNVKPPKYSPALVITTHTHTHTHTLRNALYWYILHSTPSSFHTANGLQSGQACSR